MNYDTNELYHHGVTGMKWGKRNGPPYPLNAEGKASLAKQKKASNAAGLSDESGIILKRKKKKKQLDDIPDYSKMSETEVSERKREAARKGNITEAYKNRDYYTDNELKDVKNRYSLNTEVSKLSKAQIKTGQQKAEEIASKFETASRLTSAVGNTAANSIKIINNVGAILSWLNNKEFKPIDTNFNKNENKDKKKNKNKNKNNDKGQSDNNSGEMSTSKEQYMKTRNSFATDEHKDKWEHYMDLANDSSKTKAQRTKAAEYAQKIVDVDKRNKNYKSPYKEQYSVTFLEAIQNKEILELNDTKSIDAEYAKYKQNPEKYFTEDVKKLKDV